MPEKGRGQAVGPWPRERPSRLNQLPRTSFFLSHKQDPKAKKRALELCVCAPVCWVLCVPFNTVFFRKAKSDPCQPGSEGRLLGSICWSEGAIFFSTHGDLGAGTEPGRESTLAQPPLLNYAGSLLQSLQLLAQPPYWCAACSFLLGGF